MIKCIYTFIEQYFPSEEQTHVTLIIMYALFDKLFFTAILAKLCQNGRFSAVLSDSSIEMKSSILAGNIVSLIVVKEVHEYV